MKDTAASRWIDLVAIRSTRADGHQKDRILLPNPEIQSIPEFGFLVSHQLVAGDDVVGFHGAGNVVLRNRDPTGQPLRELCES